MSVVVNSESFDQLSNRMVDLSQMIPPFGFLTEAMPKRYRFISIDGYNVISAHKDRPYTKRDRDENKQWYSFCKIPVVDGEHPYSWRNNSLIEMVLDGAVVWHELYFQLCDESLIWVD